MNMTFGPSAIARSTATRATALRAFGAACWIAVVLAVLPASRDADAAEAPGAAPHRVLASFPNGSYMENLTVSRRGEVLFTNYFAGRVELWARGSARTFATLPVHPVNIVETQQGFLVLAHAAAFTGGPDALRGSNRLLALDRKGRVTGSVDLPEIVFGNGMVLLSPASLLVTDSALGRIWRVDVATGHAESWLEDPRLLPVEGQKYPGANGLRRSGAKLYVSNSATRKLYTVLIDGAERTAGSLTEAPGSFDGIDDFAVARDGTLYIATHREAVVRWRPDGNVQTLLDADVKGCTSTALSADGRTLFVLGTGGLFEGHKEPATLVSVELPRP
jgi:sugar lactone lactonase YvrE